MRQWLAALVRHTVAGAAAAFNRFPFHSRAWRAPATYMQLRSYHSTFSRAVQAILRAKRIRFMPPRCLRQVPRPNTISIIYDHALNHVLAQERDALHARPQPGYHCGRKRQACFGYWGVSQKYNRNFSVFLRHFCVASTLDLALLRLPGFFLGTGRKIRELADCSA